MRHDLIDRTINKLPVPGEKSGPKDYADSGVRQLVLTKRPNGGAAWNLRYRIGFGKSRIQRRLTLGSWPEMKVDEAREKALAARRMLADGIDPADAELRRRVAAQDHEQAMADRSFAKLAEIFVLYQRRLGRRTWLDQARILGLRVQDGEPPRFTLIKGGVAERWANRPVAQIARFDVSSVVNEHLNAEQPAAARMRLAALKTMFGWLVSEGYIDFSPADKYKLKIPTVRRERVLSNEEIRLLWQASESEAAPFGQFIRVLLLTGQRRNEVAGMRRAELADGLWQLPKARTKNKRDHVVPLSPLALAEIESVEHASGLVFTTNGRTAISGFAKIKARLDSRMAEIAGHAIQPWTLHDLRRSAATGMASLGVPPHVVESVTNHVSGAAFAGVAGTYNRYSYLDEKRDALRRWADRVAEIVGQPADAVRVA